MQAALHEKWRQLGICEAILTTKSYVPIHPILQPVAMLF